MTHKHFKIILVTLLCLCGKEISAKKIEVQSPDGKLKVNIELKDKIYYSIYSGKDLLLDNCSLSMILNNEVLGEQPKLQAMKRGKIDESIKREIPLKNAIVENHCNTLYLKMRGNYAIEFRVFNKGLQTKRARLKLWEKISLSISLQIIWLIYLSRMVLKHHTNIHIHMFELKITSIQTE